MAASNKKCVVGYYFTPEDILEAARRTKDRQFDNFDTFTPFAVHGMDEAMGLKRSILPYVSFGAAMAGMFTGFLLQTWTHSFSWPINIAGKSLFAWPAYIPVIFELSILFCGVTTVLFMFVFLLGLPNFKKPIFHPDITNDRFALAIEVNREEEVEPVRQFLSEIKAQDIHAVEGAL